MVREIHLVVFICLIEILKLNIMLMQE